MRNIKACYCDLNGSMLDLEKQYTNTHRVVCPLDRGGRPLFSSL